MISEGELDDLQSQNKGFWFPRVNKKMYIFIFYDALNPWISGLISHIICGMVSQESAQKSLGQAIKARRKELGYSQEGFAMICELDRSYVGQIERGRSNPTLTVLRQIAFKLRLSLGDLFKRAGL